METIGDQGIELDEPPKFGLKILLNHEYSLQSKQIIIPRPKQIFDLMPLSARYLKYYLGKKMQKKRPIMDYMNMISAQRMYGCPIGGIGGGTIGRGFKGEFCRFQLYPGIYEYVTVPECQFIVNIRNDKNETIFQSVLSTYPKPKKTALEWEWNINGSDCEYTALYPRAWTKYDLTKYGIKLVCRQISPIIPHNYKDSCLPCAVFVFTAKNVSNEHRNVTIAFTWSEVLTTNKKKSPKEKVELEKYCAGRSCGVTLDQKVSDLPCTFTIAKSVGTDNTDGEYCYWSATKSSNYVWNCLKEHGNLKPDESQYPKLPDKCNTKKKEEKPRKMYTNDSMALSSTISLDPGGCDSTEFCLVWDMPIIKYKTDKKIHRRYYTKYFGHENDAGNGIAAYALKNYKNWEQQIADWQDSILNKENLPDWMKSALMNELYFIADGGTIWYDANDDYPDTDPRHQFGIFGYLEGHEYRMYNTYDVHFYASFALAQLWPNLQVVLQYMYRDTIQLETTKYRQSLYNGKSVKFKIKDTIPHDLGDPGDLPFTHINAYNIHDVSEWRDLNFKFILQVMRDYRILRGLSAPFGNERPSAEDALAPAGERGECGEREEREEREEAWGARRYLADLYPGCCILLRRSLAWDTDGDGLIENGGFPDQTYDAWVMTGPSAYCGGLWVASICVVREMARILGFEEDEKEFSVMLDRARASFDEKLWSGSFYLFDTQPANKDVIMADQLAGHWFLRASGWAHEVFPEAQVRRALASVYEHNVLRFQEGRMGAVNGYVAGARPRVDTSTLQSEEVWVGVTYGLAALMIYEDMHEQAFVTAGGLYNTLVKLGLSFETPEALYENGNHRSVGYMRPLAIWSMYQAIIARPPPPPTVTNGLVHPVKENITL